MKIIEEDFGCTTAGQPIKAYVIENREREYIRVIQLGASLQSACIRDRDGNLCDTVLGLKDAEDYETNSCFIGSTVGRICNRTKDARYTLNGKVYHSFPNENGNNLHSMPDGYNLRLWELKKTEVRGHEASVVFHLYSPDGDQGYPGACDIDLSYSFSDDHVIRVKIDTVPDQDTMINMTVHAYFNLNGEGSGNILDHYLMIHAGSYIETDKENLPQAIRNVEDTRYDFREMRPIISSYDTCFYVQKQAEPCLEAYGESSGIHLAVTTNQPCVQVYTGKYLEEQHGKHPYEAFDGLAIESEYPVNSVNGPAEEQPLIRKGQKYHWETEWKFSVR